MNTPTDNTNQHRARGRGRKLFWVAIAVGGALFLLSSIPGFGRGHQQRFRHDSQNHHSITGLADSLQDHSYWLRQAGISSDQVERIGPILEQTAGELERMGTTRDQISIQLAELLAAEEIDPSRVESLRQETKRLADEAVEQSFDTLLALANELTPEQRASIVNHWETK